MVEVKLFELYTDIKSRFIISDIKNYKMEASWILSNFFKVNSSDILLNKSKFIDNYEYDYFLDKINLRASGYPLQYIFGETFFYNRKFFVGEGVLIPRIDTETLCDVSLKLIKDNNFKSALDLCSGSGCIGITLEKEVKQFKVVCVEKSKEAIFYLNKNKVYNESNIEVVTMDIFDIPNINEFDKFDIIVSNPPYLNDLDIKNLQKEVEFEPKLALYAPDNGLEFYKIIASFWSKFLIKGGILAFEVGFRQSDDVLKILNLNNFKNIIIEKDSNNISRVVYGYKN